MKLDRVQIKNFRSLQDITIDFDPTCRVLVGINESGKSNILDALAFLEGSRAPVRRDDLREALPDEDRIAESYVWFVFRFEKEDSGALLEAVSSKILSAGEYPTIVSFGGRSRSVKAFCGDRNEGLYGVDILTEEKRPMFWRLPTNYALLPGWTKPTAACPADLVVELDGQQHTLANYRLVRAVDLTGVPQEYLEEASLEDLSSLTGIAMTRITAARLPDTLVWKYDEGNLLPESVTIANFSADPDSCVPLKNMFTLAGINDIMASIDEARKGGDNQFQNYLNRVARKMTNHFQDVWREYKHVEFSLKLNAERIILGVQEKNVHDFARRSDGFKRFVTFLLMISVKVKTDSLRDTVLLIDEPDTGLHPSGARYLRDELIRISKTNYVVFSTHSIFMVDSGDISRHFIVKKTNEVTTIESAGESNIAEEEVLYSALGHSVESMPFLVEIG